jgi:predicted nucleic acid-binding protein
VIVADSSYIVEGLLADKSLLMGELILAPDLAIYETAGAIWKHQTILGRIHDGMRYLSILSELIRTNNLLTTLSGNEVISAAYDLALRYHSHPYDAVFVAMALRTGLDLKTFDSHQREIFDREKAKRIGPTDPRLDSGKGRRT